MVVRLVALLRSRNHQAVDPSSPPKCRSSLAVTTSDAEGSVRWVCMHLEAGESRGQGGSEGAGRGTIRCGARRRISS